MAPLEIVASQYIVRLIGQVVTVSIATVSIVAGLPGLPTP